MQNFTQTIPFPVSSLLKSALPQEVVQEMIGARNAFVAYKVSASQSAPNTEELKATYEEKAKALSAKVDAKVLEELKYFGVDSLTEDVPVTMKLGMAMFDLYLMGCPAPSAPLAKMIWQKRNTELAELLDKEEFDLPDYAVGPIRSVLASDDTWSKVNLSVYAEVGGDEKRFFTMNTNGAKWFSKVLDAAASAVL